MTGSSRSECDVRKYGLANAVHGSDSQLSGWIEVLVQARRFQRILDDAIIRGLQRDVFIYDGQGVYTPLRSIQGALNSATQFQARMSEVFKGMLLKKLIIWIDDLLGYCKSYEDWFCSLENTLRTAQRCNIKFNVTKL